MKILEGELFPYRPDRASSWEDEMTFFERYGIIIFVPPFLIWEAIQWIRKKLR
jgi:hypothetical protein